MTGLLVSVRSAEEAVIALAGGADVIDVKEPRNGALGAAEPAVWREVLAVVGGRAVGEQVMTSAALGELHGGVDFRAVAADAAGFQFVKIGLWDAWRRKDTERKWGRACEAFSGGPRVVPVVYADIGAMSAESLAAGVASAVAMARQSRSCLVVIDTFDKRRGNLLDHATVRQLRETTEAAADADARLVLAGSLDDGAIEKLLTSHEEVDAALRQTGTSAPHQSRQTRMSAPWGPAYVGVRGAACVGGRDGAIDLGRVKSLKRIVASARCVDA